MILLKFPALDKALTKAKDLEENDPRTGVVVINNHAIVYHKLLLFAVDLYDYFTIECGISDYDEQRELDSILFYMNYKVFPVDFWKELTKGAEIKMHNGNLHVQTPKYAKELIYKELDYDLLKPLKNIVKMHDKEQNLLSAVAIPFVSLKMVYDCLSSDFKTDAIIFEMTGQDSIMKFTFQDRKHFYGYFTTLYDAAQEGYRFSSLELLVQEQDFQDFYKDLLEEEESKIAPPPPPAIEEKTDEEDEDDNQLKLV